MIGQPGQVFTPDYRYDPRWYFGQDGTIKIVSLVADEDLPTGVMVQIKPSTERIHLVRDLVAVAGLVTYDPNRRRSDMLYKAGDVVPVMRRGSCFCRFAADQAPFADPQAFANARVYANTGVLTTDLTGTLALSAICFSLANKDYYQTSSGSPAADLPNPVPPLLPGVQDTTFGAGIALVDMNLG